MVENDQENKASGNDLPLLTYNSLYNILREEKKVKMLQKLPELFFESLEKYFFDKKTEIKKLKETGSDKLKKEMHILNTSKKVALEIIHIRNLKISDIAIKSEIFSDESYVSENILEREKEFYENVRKATSKTKKVVS